MSVIVSSQDARQYLFIFFIKHIYKRYWHVLIELKPCPGLIYP